ncbi:DoxX family protein [Psychromonas algicola]|uniref:DoxX family protein n=1 Tax=Psychromonas algicola TaxID=2555642 RepID=UPI001068918C|nr:hypothetical protein [Psychromonas sp. RZ5]TEW51474.1 hypothetical protein E2R67_07820 [Psychromonas sp. RZ5]
MLTPIIILLLLSLPLFVAFVYTRINNNKLDVKKFASWGLGIAFIFFFIGHIVRAQGMTEMLPTWVPFRLALIYITGLLELLIGIALFVPRYQSIATKLAIIVFIVFFPANIYSALNYIGLGGHQWGPVYLIIRGPLQLVLIGWAYFLCLEGNIKAFKRN